MTDDTGVCNAVGVTWRQVRTPEEEEGPPLQAAIRRREEIMTDDTGVCNAVGVAWRQVRIPEEEEGPPLEAVIRRRAEVVTDDTGVCNVQRLLMACVLGAQQMRLLI
jgi:hypothetical protein